MQLTRQDETLFYQFAGDEMLGYVQALRKTNDLFDIVQSWENDHSEILAWLFNPREGHGQGDAIFKDFLLSAFMGEVAKNSETYQFFKYWTPARISITGFQSLIIRREFVLKCGRLDLLIVDPINRLIVVVENKTKAQIGDEQLRKYREELGEILTERGFKEYGIAYIALDAKKRDEDDSEADEEEPVSDTRELNVSWAHINYQWLEAAAKRAEIQQRLANNQSASLVINYCHRQTGYVSPQQQEMELLLATLANNYRQLLPKLRDALAAETEVLHGDTFKLKNAWSAMLVLVHSNRELMRELLHARHLGLVRARLLAKLGGDDAVEIRVFQKRLLLADKKWLESNFWKNKPTDKGAKRWPLQVVVRETSSSASDNPKYRIFLMLWRDFIVDGELPSIAMALKKEFPEIGKHKDSKVRRFRRMENVPEEDIVEKTTSLYREALKALEKHVKST